MTATSQQLLDWVDETDRVIGRVSRNEALRVGANFRVAHLFLFNSRSEILLQQLALSRPRHPGCWGASVAAYVASGEDYRQAIERRAREELGVGLESLERVCKTSMPEEGGTKFITLFSARSDGPFKVDSGYGGVGSNAIHRRSCDPARCNSDHRSRRLRSWDPDGSQRTQLLSAINLQEGIDRAPPWADQSTDSLWVLGCDPLDHLDSKPGGFPRNTKQYRGLAGPQDLHPVQHRTCDLAPPASRPCIPVGFRDRPISGLHSMIRPAGTHRRSFPDH